MIKETMYVIEVTNSDFTLLCNEFESFPQSESLLLVCYEDEIFMGTYPNGMSDTLTCTLQNFEQNFDLFPSPWVLFTNCL